MQDWTYYLGNNLTKVNQIVPYQGILQTDTSMESGGLDGTKITSLNADQITTGFLSAVATLGTSLGTSYIRIDGSNQRFIAYDGSNNRIVIGNPN